MIGAYERNGSVERGGGVAAYVRPKLLQLPHPNGECTPTKMVLVTFFGDLVMALVGYRIQ